MSSKYIKDRQRDEKRNILNEIREMLRKDSEEVVRIIEQTDQAFYNHFKRIEFKPKLTTFR